VADATPPNGRFHTCSLPLLLPFVRVVSEDRGEASPDAEVMVPLRHFTGFMYVNSYMKKIGRLLVSLALNRRDQLPIHPKLELLDHHRLSGEKLLQHFD
jgi:hypothetical protein